MSLLIIKSFKINKNLIIIITIIITLFTSIILFYSFANDTQETNNTNFIKWVDFNITSEDEVNLDKPTLYNNLANPIVLSYINHNIKTDYTITDTSTPMTYDGSLLKRCNILLNNIACSFSFDVYVTNNLSQEFKCTIYIDIPLDLDNQSIYNGNITLKKDTNFNFYRYR